MLLLLTSSHNELVLMFLSKRRKNSHESADFVTQESELLSYFRMSVDAWSNI